MNRVDFSSIIYHYTGVKIFCVAWKSCVAGLMIVIGGVFFATAILAATYTVNTTNDGDDGSCTHPYVDAANDCTLHEAIDAANANAGADSILFSISTANFADDGDGQFTISVTAVLPSVTGVTTISAVSMWDSTGTLSGRPGVRILGTGAPSTADGIALTGGSSLVQGLKIDGFPYAGLKLATANSNSIGTNCDGTNDATERNIIVNNGRQGIWVQSTSASNVIAGNYIGIDENGSTEAGNSESADTAWGMSGIILNSNGNTVGYGSSSCSAASQRNIISGTGTATMDPDATTLAAIMIDGASNNTIAGNYIGTDANGISAVPSYGAAIFVGGASNYNFIGTNGDGVNDSNEGNVISGNASHGIMFWATSGQDAAGSGGPDFNRVAGNWIGFGADGSYLPNEVSGINTRANAEIIGWCDTSIDATLCSDAGALANQRNYLVGGTGDDVDALRFGLRSDSTEVYGNIFGVSPTAATVSGVQSPAIRFVDNTEGHIIGGASTNQQNEIAKHKYGVSIARLYGTNSDPMENFTITGNNIHNNTKDGIYCDNSMSYASGTLTYEGVVSGNTISDNGESGIDAGGCSLDIQNNTVTGNTQYGIYSTSNYKPDDTAGYSNAYDTLSPNNAADDLVSRPRIQGNTVGSNSSGGIYLLDTLPTNATTLIADNTLNSNSGFRLKQAWYGAVEIFNNGTTPYTSGSHTVTLTPASGSCSTCVGSTVASAGSGNAIWGLSGVSYNDATTWFTVPDYEVNASGQTVNYNPYTITTSGATSNQTGTSYSFNGSNDDTASAGGLPNGISTNSTYRYQIAEIKSSSVPTTPTNSSPSDAATSVSLTPTLSASAFSDTSETHTSTTWRIYSTSALCTAGGAGNVLDTTSTSAKTSLTLSSALSAETTYYWRAAYTNSFGNISSYSNCTSFTTLRTKPTFSGEIANQTWNEDTTLSDAFDLDDYFTDVENETLTYTITNSESNITLTIDAHSNRVSFASESNWNGSGIISLTGCDPDGECASSNEFTATVQSVNDAPTAPETGFTPANGDRTSNQTPKISWQAATDADHSANQLTYKIRIADHNDPVNNYIYQSTTAVGKTSHRINITLNDETDYYYAVRTIDPDNATSEWSAVQTFYVNTELTPEIVVNKEVTRVDSTSAALRVLQKILRALSVVVIHPVNAQSSTGHIAFVIETLLIDVMWLTLLLFGLCLIALFAMGRSFRDIRYLLWQQPALVFSRIHQAEQAAVQHHSFYRFKNKLLFYRVISLCSLLLFSFSVAVNADRINIVKYGIQSVVSSLSVEPNNRLQVSIDFNNIGDGDATNAMLRDAFPADTSYVPNSLQVSNNFSAAVSNISATDMNLVLGTITDSNQSKKRQGSVSYQLQVNNPYPSNQITFPTAGMTANELDVTARSNQLVVKVTSANIQGRVFETIEKLSISNVVVSLLINNDTIAQTTTDENGYYSFVGLASGTYVLSVVPPSQYTTPENKIITIQAGQTYSNNDFVILDSNDPKVDPIIKDPIDDPTTNDPDRVDDDESTDVEEDIDDDMNLIDLPPEVMEDFINVPNRTAEEMYQAEQLAEGIVLIEVNNQTVKTRGQTVYIGTDFQLLKQFAKDVQRILLPTQTDEFVLKGQGPPNALMKISICYGVLETTTDEQGQWVMTIPREMLRPGENVIFTNAEQDGIVSDQVEVARIVIEDHETLSRTSLFSSIMLFVSSVLAILFAYYLFIKRRRILLREISNRKILWIACACAGVSIMLFIGTIVIHLIRVYNLTADILPEQDTIVLQQMNGQETASNASIKLDNVKQMSLNGIAPAQTTMAITFCDNRPMKTIEVGANQTWSTQFPVELLPKGKFQVSAQIVHNGQFGQPHRLSDVSIESQSLSLYGRVLLIISYIMLIAAVIAFWIFSQQINVNKIDADEKNISKSATE